MIHYLTWGVAVLSLAATIANIHKRRWCFAVWFATNATWAIVDAKSGIHAQAALQAIYAGLSVWGWLTWGKKA
jgi:nicotinamide riboside transporter PnuC